MNAPDILVDVEHTAVSADALAGTELDTPPGNGLLLLWCGSTVNTATLEVPQFNHSPGVTNLIPLTANGIPLVNQMVPYKIDVRGNKRPIINLGGTTGTVHITAAFFRSR